MNIAVIAAGNVGTTLALAFRKAGHSVVFGVRQPEGNFKRKDFVTGFAFAFHSIDQAVAVSEVIVLCTPGEVAHEVAKQLGDVSNKVIIDTMNAVFKKPAHYTNTSDAVLDNCNCTDLAKCFNTTGFENMADPDYNGVALDMAVAGNSIKAKQVAAQLAKDIGFGEVYDLGGNDKFNLIEQWAMCWINLAILQKVGRNIGFKILKR